MSRPRATYANVTATLALVFALGGGAYAATQLPKDSVGSKQVKDHSLKSKDFKTGQLPAGPQGPKGATGAPGKDGAPGPNLLTVGSKHGDLSIPFNPCNGYDFYSGRFTVPQKALLHVDATLGWFSQNPHTVEAKVFLIDIKGSGASEVREAVGLTGVTETFNVTQVNPAPSGLMTVNGDVDAPLALLPGHTYELQLQAVDPNFAICSESGTIRRPTIQWMTFPFPNA